MKGEKSENTNDSVRSVDIVGEIALVPDSLFFYQTDEKPKRLPPKQLNEWVYNKITEVSPLPMDQLLWGFVERETAKGGYILLWYAGLKERILGVAGDLPNGLHAIPYFALGFLLAQEGGQIFTGDKFTSVLVDKKIFGFYKTEEASFTHIQQCLSTANVEIGDQLTRIKIVSSNVGYSGDIKLVAECKSLEGSVKMNDVTLRADVIWSADIRDKALIKSLKMQRQVDKVSQIGIRMACMFLILLFSFEVCLMGAKLCLLYKERTKNFLQPKALSIESKDFLVRKIQNTVEQEIRPFELISILNDFRPKSIYFLSSMVDNLHNVVVEAIAETAIAAETYRQQLDKSGYFESVTIENMTTTYQGTKFSLVCDFKEKNKTSFLALENPS
ncbi:MAG: hypothetical protein LBJ78_02975 [Puniceicoccales bacterium]|jgi:hypothetical protein|nr:hypothetical protein [Puniceicoccales bacterium]